MGSVGDYTSAGAGLMFVFNLKKLRLLVLFAVVVLCFLCLLQAKWFWRLFYPWPYRQEIIAVAVHRNIDPHLLAALIRVESRFDPSARSDAGAIGLMQVMPDTAASVAKEIGMRNFHPELLYQPEINLQIGAWYLANLFQEFDGNVVVGLAAYNAGRGNVRVWLESGKWEGTVEDIERIPFPETRVYLKTVLRDYEVYKYLYE
ncbi:MAG: lytic transglycosylase domain-containing protein [Thermacetogeniaceae bacterium]